MAEISGYAPLVSGCTPNNCMENFIKRLVFINSVLKMLACRLSSNVQKMLQTGPASISVAASSPT